MERLEIHTLICKRDINWFIATIKLFSYHSKLDFDIIVHEDGSFNRDDIKYLQNGLSNVVVINRRQADEEIKSFLKDLRCVKLHNLLALISFADLLGKGGICQEIVESK